MLNSFVYLSMSLLRKIFDHRPGKIDPTNKGCKMAEETVASFDPTTRVGGANAGLSVQDLNNLDITKLTPLTPEVSCNLKGCQC
jgi:hypothetical protein